MSMFRIGESVELTVNLPVTVIVKNQPLSVVIHAGELARITASAGLGWEITTKTGIATTVLPRHIRAQRSEYLLPELAPAETICLF